MNPVEPSVPHGSQLVIYAKDQPQYLQLPAAVDPEGVVVTEWELTEDEIHRILMGGRVQLRVLTFKDPLQPVALAVLEPECGFGVVKES